MKSYMLLILSLLLFISCSNKSTEIIINADNVEGLSTTSKITINGFEIGEVKDIKIATDGTINIRTVLYTDTNIPSDSKFRLENTSLLGSKSITVELGQSSNQLKDGDVIKIAPSKVNNTSNTLKAKINSIIDDITGKQKQDSILIELRRLNENLEQLHNEIP